MKSFVLFFCAVAAASASDLVNSQDALVQACRTVVILLDQRAAEENRPATRSLCRAYRELAKGVTNKSQIADFENYVNQFEAMNADELAAPLGPEKYDALRYLRPRVLGPGWTHRDLDSLGNEVFASDGKAIPKPSETDFQITNPAFITPQNFLSTGVKSAQSRLKSSPSGTLLKKPKDVPVWNGYSFPDLRATALQRILEKAEKGTELQSGTYGPFQFNLDAANSQIIKRPDLGGILKK